MKLKNSILFSSYIIYLFFLNHLNAQDLITEKNTISLSILGTSSYVGVTYERMITDELVGELGIGLLSVGLGGTFYPWKIKENHINFYTGLKYRSRNIITKVFLIDDKKDPVFYIPIGLNYSASEGMNLALDVGPSLHGSMSIFANLRVGFRF